MLSVRVRVCKFVNVNVCVCVNVNVCVCDLCGAPYRRIGASRHTHTHLWVLPDNGVTGSSPVPFSLCLILPLPLHSVAIRGEKMCRRQCGGGDATPGPSALSQIYQRQQIGNSGRGYAQLDCTAYTHAHTYTLTHIHTLTQSFTHKHTIIGTHTNTLAQSPTLTFTHTHTHTHCL